MTAQELITLTKLLSEAPFIFSFFFVPILVVLIIFVSMLVFLDRKTKGIMITLDNKDRENNKLVHKITDDNNSVYMKLNNTVLHVAESIKQNTETLKILNVTIQEMKSSVVTCQTLTMARKR